MLLRHKVVWKSEPGEEDAHIASWVIQMQGGTAGCVSEEKVISDNSDVSEAEVTGVFV